MPTPSLIAEYDRLYKAAKEKQDNFLLGPDEVYIAPPKPKHYSLFLELCIIAIAVGALWAMV